MAASFGGSNIDPTAWEDKKYKGESRFPAQVRIRVRKLCKALEEDSFRPVLHHYDGPKFRLELSVPEAWIFLVLIIRNYFAQLLSYCWFLSSSPYFGGWYGVRGLILETLDLLDLCEQAGPAA